MGGTNYARIFKDVLISKLGEGGALGPWSMGRPLPAANAGMGIAVDGRRIYVAAGQNNATFPMAVYSSGVLDDGTHRAVGGGAGLHVAPPTGHARRTGAVLGVFAAGGEPVVLHRVPALSLRRRRGSGVGARLVLDHLCARAGAVVLRP